jgi:formate dehydrogenase subunit gamma
MTMATVTETIIGAKPETRMISRFDIHQRAQHLGLAVSFIMLVITGLPMKFFGLGASVWWAGVWGGVENLRASHHFFAYMMVVVCVYHIIWLLYQGLVLKKPVARKMVPNKYDAITLAQEIKYFVGITKVRPKFDRYAWREKFDYWAIFWGVPVMAGSGFVLMYPVLVTKFLPGWAVPIAYIAHSDEAMLALLWIFVVHIFFAHFSPAIFPFNKVIFTGKMNATQYRHEHALEYENIMAAEQQAAAMPSSMPDITPPAPPAATDEPAVE